MKNNINEECSRLYDNFSSTYFSVPKMNFIIETTNIKDMSPNLLTYVVKIYLNEESLSIPEMVEIECNKINENLKKLNSGNQRKFSEFLSKKFIKLILNSQIFESTNEKKRFILQYMHFLGNFMLKFHDWEIQHIWKENLNLIEKNEFISCVSLLEMMHIHLDYISNKNLLYDVENILKTMVVTLLKLFPFNMLLKTCFQEIKDKDFKFTDYYFDYKDMKYLNYQSHASINKIVPSDKNIFFMFQNVFYFKNLISFFTNNEKSQKIFIFGEEGSGKSSFLSFISNHFKEAKFIISIEGKEKSLKNKLSNFFF